MANTHDSQVISNMETDTIRAAVDGGITVTFFAHAVSAVEERRRQILSTLETLSATETIDDYSLEFWPRVVSLDELKSSRRDGVIEAFRDFQEWAEDEGVSICPPFSVRDYLPRTRIYTPHMAMAIYEAGEIKHVYPHRCEEGLETIADGLKRLEAISEEAPTLEAIDLPNEGGMMLENPGPTT